MNQENSWPKLTPGILHHDRQAVFGPKEVHSFHGSQDAGIYTGSELSKFWDSILTSAASRNSLKKVSQKLIVILDNK